MNALRWTPAAIQDRHDIYDYIEADNPSAALELDELFAEKCSRLRFAPCLHPHSDPTRTHPWHPLNLETAVDRYAPLAGSCDY